MFCVPVQGYPFAPAQLESRLGKTILKIALARRARIMQKLFSRATGCLCLVIFLSSHPVYCAEQDPVQFITEFYTWYISAQNRMDEIKGKDICRYVAQETLEGINMIPDRSGYDRTDYFLKLSYGPSDMKGVSILINQVETISHNTFASIVTIVYVDRFGHRFPDGVIVVILKSIEGNLKIFKCIDAYPEA